MDDGLAIPDQLYGRCLVEGLPIICESVDTEVRAADHDDRGVVEVDRPRRAASLASSDSVIHAFRLAVVGHIIS